MKLREGDMHDLAETQKWKLDTFRKNYVIGQEKRAGIVVFQATYQRTPHAKPSDDGKLRDLNSEYFWLTVTSQSILPKPGVWDKAPLPYNIIYT
jgi:hypothetical protein